MLSPNKKARRGCMCAPCVAERRQARLRCALRELGKPALVMGADAEVAFTRVRDFYARGMSSLVMAKRMGVSSGTTSELITGVRSNGRPVKGVLRRTYNKIMALEFEEPVYNGQPNGAHVNPVGTRRRLQALAAIGFGITFLSGELGTTRAHCGRMMIGEESQQCVLYTTARRMKEVYDKYRDANPLDFGATPYSIGRAKATARKRNYAPPGCWDDDAIDDPETFPEWTGACGSEEGYRIHQREKHQFTRYKKNGEPFNGNPVRTCERCAPHYPRKKNKEC